ncbi:PAS domain-containing protein [Sorangium sp. So ce1099]|uniref:PAS domain-containing protein n=1 Tax=Sorangium sp. So ce1099 TaxID=3133331 RepID=UPI003F628D10
MHADLTAFPEPLAVLDSSLQVREANVAWRDAFGEAARLAPEAEEAAREVLGGARSRLELEIDAAPGDGASPQRWAFLRCARSEGEPLVFVHARTWIARPGDASAQRRREDEQAEELELLRTFINLAPNLMFIKDRCSRYVMANNALAACYGVTPEQVVSASQHELTAIQEEAVGFASADRQVIDTGQPVVIAEKETRANGEVHWYETVKTPILRRSGEVQVACFSVDVTERQRAQEALERSARELQDMAAAARREADKKSALAAELDRRLAVIQAQQQQIQALSAPILEVADGIVGVPLIGAMDEERTATLTERLLDIIATRQVRSVVLDLSALELIDTRTADRLISIVRAIGLLGARAAVTGIQPAVAQTMTSLGIDLSSIVTTRTPKDAIRLFSTRA